MRNFTIEMFGIPHLQQMYQTYCPVLRLLTEVSCVMYGSWGMKFVIVLETEFRLYSCSFWIFCYLSYLVICCVVLCCVVLCCVVLCCVVLLLCWVVGVLCLCCAAFIICHNAVKISMLINEHWVIINSIIIIIIIIITTIIIIIFRPLQWPLRTQSNILWQKLENLILYKMSKTS